MRLCDNNAHNLIRSSTDRIVMSHIGYNRKPDNVCGQGCAHGTGICQTDCDKGQAPVTRS